MRRAVQEHDRLRPGGPDRATLADMDAAHIMLRDLRRSGHCPAVHASVRPPTGHPAVRATGSLPGAAA
jgi:hypothetical protein